MSGAGEREWSADAHVRSCSLNTMPSRKELLRT